MSELVMDLTVGTQVQFPVPLYCYCCSVWSWACSYSSFCLNIN